jgi:mRNA interferase MazF
MTGDVGALVAIPFPYTDLQITKRRPAVVVASADRLGDIITLAVTSVATETNAVAITNDDLKEGTLPKSSWIRCDKVFTINAGIVVKRYGRLSDAALSKVQRTYCRCLGCS